MNRYYFLPVNSFFSFIKLPSLLFQIDGMNRYFIKGLYEKEIFF